MPNSNKLPSVPTAVSIAIIETEIKHIQITQSVMKESQIEIQKDVKELLKFRVQVGIIVAGVSGIISLAISIFF